MSKLFARFFLFFFPHADFREHLLLTGIFYMEMKRGNRKKCRVDMWFTSLKSHFLGKGVPGNVSPKIFMAA